MSRAEIFAEIDRERAHQEDRWGNTADDTLNRPNDWAAFISHYATGWFNGGFAPYPGQVVETFRRSMIKVATLAVAAVESMDRQRAAGRPFYEQEPGQ